MSDRFVVAKPDPNRQKPLIISLTGPSGSGKTYSAMAMGTGIAKVNGGPVIVIDTENHRAEWYTKYFDFLHMDFQPPFGASDYRKAIAAAVAHCKGGPGVIIIDSMSHEHEGPGGMLEQHTQLLDKWAGDDWSKREKNNMRAWAQIKPIRRQLINDMQRAPVSLILCFRTKEISAPAKGDGKTKINYLGHVPVGADEYIYEATVGLFLPHAAKGYPDLNPEHQGGQMATKIPRQFMEILKPGILISHEIGEKMASWASGGPKTPKPTTKPSNQAPQPAPTISPTAPAPAETHTPGAWIDPPVNPHKTQMQDWLTAVVGPSTSKDVRHYTALERQVLQITDLARRALRQGDMAAWELLVDRLTFYHPHKGTTEQQKARDIIEAAGEDVTKLVWP